MASSPFISLQLAEQGLATFSLIGDFAMGGQTSHPPHRSKESLDEPSRSRQLSEFVHRRRASCELPVPIAKTTCRQARHFEHVGDETTCHPSTQILMAIVLQASRGSNARGSYRMTTATLVGELSLANFQDRSGAWCMARHHCCRCDAQARISHHAPAGRVAPTPFAGV